jgi:hypothetical protein
MVQTERGRFGTLGRKALGSKKLLDGGDDNDAVVAVQSLLPRMSDRQCGRGSRTRPIFESWIPMNDIQDSFVRRIQK